MFVFVLTGQLSLSFHIDGETIFAQGKIILKRNELQYGMNMLIKRKYLVFCGIFSKHTHHSCILHDYIFSAGG